MTGNGQQKHWEMYLIMRLNILPKEVLSLIGTNCWGLTNRMDNECIYYTTADVFKKMASDRFLMSYSFDVEDEKESGFSKFVEQIRKNE